MFKCDSPGLDAKSKHQTDDKAGADGRQLCATCSTGPWPTLELHHEAPGLYCARDLGLVQLAKAKSGSMTMPGPCTDRPGTGDD
jgi:hypothetical protein